MVSVMSIEVTLVIGVSVMFIELLLLNYCLDTKHKKDIKDTYDKYGKENISLE